MAFTLYGEAAKQGLASAQYNLALAYDKGWGTAEDPRQAVHWYEESASQGDAHAQCNLAVLLFTGRGVERDDGRAVHLTESAALQGYAVAQNNLGNVYSRGLGGRPKDFALAVYWYRLAAEQGDATGLWNVGIANEHGVAVPRNLGLAYVLYRLAADRGSDPARASADRLEISLSSHQNEEAARLVRTWKPHTPLPDTFPYQ
jgi:TPR repeat protein